jgi:NADH:ubiquinone oxidoreductase subunit 3 (subunit A)
MLSLLSFGLGSWVPASGPFVAIALVLSVAVLLLGLGLLLGGVSSGRVQSSAYECGFEAFGVVGSGHAVGFEVYALAFLLFDVEAVLLFPLVGVELPFLSLCVAVEFVVELALGIAWFLRVVPSSSASPWSWSSVSSLASSRLASSSLGGVRGYNRSVLRSRLRSLLWDSRSDLFWLEVPCGVTPNGFPMTFTTWTHNATGEIVRTAIKVNGVIAWDSLNDVRWNARNFR